MKTIKQVCLKPKGAKRVTAALAGLAGLQTELQSGIEEIDADKLVIEAKQAKLDAEYDVLNTTKTQAREALANVQAILPKSLVS
mgnify:CR=1 FL=1